ncbi:ATP-dependent carboxylate-amine ligase [Roseibium aggregatum]|uniref:ATP-dependent carboxylate-amine ligase n=1 Tax=Roseibium aggregatum TaxID=187304 RepID=A0A939EIE2_9HYPH|nr:ATP-dependent carboxylate-amine ligase [Roseibium aggregatum]MBN9673251.1 ATP-dependent carboxylate-amine ligase [Roseibium aggregatum]
MTESDTARPRSLVYRLLDAYCRRTGLCLSAADSHGHAGLVETPDGTRRFFKGTRFDLNSQGAAEIANDKAYSLGFLRQSGLPVPAFHVAEGSPLRNGQYPPEEVFAFAEEAGFPLYVKPNCGREGKGVMRALTKSTLQNVLHVLAERNFQILIQQEILGRDLRVIVLDGEVLCVLERRAPEVTGDGRSSLANLIEAHETIDAADGRIDFELSQQGQMRQSIPEKDRVIRLLPVSNLSSGGMAEIVTDVTAPEILAIARDAARCLSLRYAAVDMILPEDRPDAVGFILEVNAAPGFTRLHRQGPEEAALVEGIYEKVFDAMFGG